MYAGITDYLLNDRLGERKKLGCEYAKMVVAGGYLTNTCWRKGMNI